MNVRETFLSGHHNSNYARIRLAFLPVVILLLLLTKDRKSLVGLNARCKRQQKKERAFLPLSFGARGSDHCLVGIVGVVRNCNPIFVG